MATGTRDNKDKGKLDNWLIGTTVLYILVRRGGAHISRPRVARAKVMATAMDPQCRRVTNGRHQWRLIVKLINAT